MNEGRSDLMESLDLSCEDTVHVDGDPQFLLQDLGKLCVSPYATWYL